MTPLELGAAATVAAFAFPLILSAMTPIALLRPLAVAIAPWAALPALLLAVGLFRRAEVDWEWAVFGVRLGSSTALTRGFLLFTSILWLASGVFARTYVANDPHRARFFRHWLATCCGSIGVIIARDVASFYSFYVLMTFAAYGLIVHERTPAARRAGQVYVVMALLGEVLLMAGFILVVGTDINLDLRDVPRVVGALPEREVAVVLFLTGFGVKAGAILLHMWLPLAHPVAPTPASAILSGALIAAGLLGWLRFLPLGVIAMPTHGSACVAAGIVAAFYGIGVGMMQGDPKTILAYSSVSQMGLMTVAVGIGLANPAVAPAAITATLFYAVHHALAKGALFLGTGVARATGSGIPGLLVSVGLLWPALDLAGAPLSSGALAKLSLKDVVKHSPWRAAELSLLLSLAAAGTTLLMAHFLWRTVPRRSSERRAPSVGLFMPWLLLLVVDQLVLLMPPVETAELGLLTRPETLWDATWPILVGIGIGSLVLRRRGARIELEIPPGDVIRLVERSLHELSSLFRAIDARLAAARSRALRVRIEPLARASEGFVRATERVETSMATFGTIGLLFASLLFASLVALLWSLR